MVCARCKNEVTEKDKKTKLCFPCLDEVNAIKKKSKTEKVKAKNYIKKIKHIRKKYNVKEEK